MSSIKAIRYHDFSMGHRVVGHEGKCKYLHGHNYRIHFHCEAPKLDNVGRVVDFSVIKRTLCQWLENNWDHKTLLWEKDPMANLPFDDMTEESFFIVKFNPTAENIAEYLVNVIGPMSLAGTGVRLTKCVVEETRKCSVEYSL